MLKKAPTRLFYGAKEKLLFEAVIHLRQTQPMFALHNQMQKISGTRPCADFQS